MVDTTYKLDVIISNFFRIRYINGDTNEDITDYLIDFTLKKELEKTLDKLDLLVSRRIANEAWFDGFGPDVEILLQYGSTHIFRGRVKDRDLKQTYIIEVYSSAEITSRKVANIVYNDQSPESIFSNLISTYTDLTPQTPTASGTIIDRFVATEYVDSLIKKLAEILDWQIWSDAYKNIYLEPRGNTTNSNTISRNANSVADDNLKYSSDAEVTHNSGTYMTRKTITLTQPINGSIRIKFDKYRSSGNDSCYIRILKNESVSNILVSEVEYTNTEYDTVSNDVTEDFIVGDTIDLQMREVEESYAKVRNFRIYYTNNTNALFGKWKEFHNELANRVILVGDKVQYNTSELFSGDNSTVSFTLTEVPINIVVYISDVEQDTVTYAITATDRTVTFDTAPTTGSENIKIEYTYAYPIYCDKKNQTSIDTHGEFVKKIWLTWIKSRKDAINYALEYIGAYKDPLKKNILILPIKELVNYNVGEEVNIDDNLESIDDNFLIHKIIAKYTKGYMEMQVGNTIPTFSTSQSMVMDRIKELEKSTDIVIAQLSESSQEDITITETFDDSDTDYLNHKLQGTYPPRCNYGRGTSYDTRVGLCQVKG